MTNIAIAEAFSGHRFEEALEHFSERAVWTLVGGEVLVGRLAITAGCRATSAEAAGVTRFIRFETVGDGDRIAVKTVSVYSEPSGTTGAVASVDLYEFESGEVVGLRSYTVEVEPE